MNSLFRTLAAALMLAVAVPVAGADGDKTYDRVSFQVEVAREVGNDRAVAVLSVNEEDKDPARLAGRINAAMRWARELADAERKVRTHSGTYRTYPVYDDKKIVRWRGRQDIVLESGDVEALSRLAGRLQSRLQMRSLGFSVAPDTRRQVEESLIEQALKSFQARAERIRSGLGAAGYRIVNISLGTSGQPPMPPVRAESVRRVASAAIQPPVLDSGTSRIRVQASGTIQLERKAVQ